MGHFINHLIEKKRERMKKKYDCSYGNHLCNRERAARTRKNIERKGMRKPE
jgi:hypothetical protein